MAFYFTAIILLTILFFIYEKISFVLIVLGFFKLVKTVVLFKVEMTKTLYIHKTSVTKWLADDAQTNLQGLEN